MIPISAPMLGEPEEKLVLEVLRSGQLAQGPTVEQFEKAVADLVGTKNAVAVSDGTSALIAALIANGIGPGDEVITSPFTFIATLNAILFVGARPRFADIDDDYSIRADAIEALIDDSTKAILPVHLYGLLSDMENIGRVADRHDLAIIEDAAQAIGATSTAGNAGTFGTACFSFYATKNLTTGEGGMITTNSDATADTLRCLRNQGQEGRYQYVMPGFNFRMTEIEAAIGVAQISRFTEITARRRENAETLTAGLSGIDGLALPNEPPGYRHVFNQFTVRADEKVALSRDRLKAFLEGRGIQSEIYYPRPVFDYPHLGDRIGADRDSTPRATLFSEQVLSLPVHPMLTSSDLDRIVVAVRSAMKTSA